MQRDEKIGDCKVSPLPELPPELWCDIITRLNPETIVTKVALVSRLFYEMVMSSQVMGKKLPQHFGGHRRVEPKTALYQFSMFRNLYLAEYVEYSPRGRKWLSLIKEGDIFSLNKEKLDIECIFPMITEVKYEHGSPVFDWIITNQRLRDFLFELIYVFFSEKNKGYDVLYNGYTLLHYLAMLGPSRRLVKKLMPEFNASQPVYSIDGIERFTPLHYAVARNFIDTCALLLEHQALINMGSKDNCPPFFTAAIYGHTDLIEFFYLHGIRDVDEPKYRGNTALWMAVHNGHRHTAEKLLDLGADPNYCYEQTALVIAARTGDADMIKLLCKHGANKGLNDEYSDEITPLRAACLHGIPAAVGALLESGANPNQDSPCGTLLFTATRYKHYDAVRLLLIFGAKVDAVSADGNTALFVAAELGLVNVTKLLIKYNAKVNLQNNRGLTALYYACQNGHTPVVKKLLKAGASPYLLNTVRCSPLHIAAYNGHYSVVEALLPKANINQQDELDATPIHYAIQKKHLDVVRLLLKHGADPRIKSIAEIPVLILENLLLVKMLVEAFPDLIYVTDSHGRRSVEYLRDNYNNDRSDLYTYLKDKEENEEPSTALAVKL